MKRERSFKSGTILTDGKILIYLGHAEKPDWTPSNNYGRKQTEYWGGDSWPRAKNGYAGDLRISLKRDSVEVPGLWLQDGHELHNFRAISKKLISEKILKAWGI